MQVRTTLHGLHFNFWDLQWDLAVDFAFSTVATLQERIPALKVKLAQIWVQRQPLTREESLSSG